MRAASLHATTARRRPMPRWRASSAEWVGAPGAAVSSTTTRARPSTAAACTAALTPGTRLSVDQAFRIGVFLALFQSRLGPDNTTLLVAVMGVLAIVAAARESYAYRKGDKELSKQYRYMLNIFANARKRLDTCTMPASKREILRELGEAALAEHSEWALMHRDRPLESARF